jgi:hypothetical protein
MGEQPENTKAMSRKLFSNAVDDAQFLVAYAAGKCKNDIDETTLTTLINAKRSIDEKQPIDAKTEAEFWLAYQKIWKLVRPVTAESVKANLSVEPRFVSNILANIQPVPKWVDKNIPGLFHWAKTRTTSRARRTVNRFIFFTVLVLIVVLVLQIYWVIGNQLTAQLAELLKKETELSQEISTNRDEYSAIEMRFKQNEWDSESFKTNGIYTFYSSPDWERDILDNLSAKAKLESDLTSLKSQLERNSAVLMIWSIPWKPLIDQSVNDTNLEGSDQLADQFVLVILQSYLLPLLYGILGAGTFVLRSLSKEVDNETFSSEKGIRHVLRVSLGALAGILVGWFSVLIPTESTTFIGSISPLAIAFLVGYNIELFFALMDRALFSITDRLQRPAPVSQQETNSNQASNNTSTESGKPKTGGMQAPAAAD